MTPLPSTLDWYRNGPLACYLHEVRAPEGCDVNMFEARQEAGDVSDPPVSDIVVTQLLGTFPFRSDLGAGTFSGHGTADQFVVVPPRVATSIVVDTPHEIRSLNIPATAACRWLGRDEDDPLDFGPLHAGLCNDPYIAQTLYALWRELSSGDQTARLFVETAAASLLWRLNRLAETSVAPGFARGGLAPWQARRVTEYLAEKLADDVSLNELAALVNLSPFHFARAFKKTVGLPPHRYHMRLRLERARSLLRDTDLTVADIAHAVGYETAQAFSRMFRREMGMPPSDFRRAIRS